MKNYIQKNTNTTFDFETSAKKTGSAYFFKPLNALN